VELITATLHPLAPKPVYQAWVELIKFEEIL
jgi:hypothetical protein